MCSLTRCPHLGSASFIATTLQISPYQKNFAKKIFCKKYFLDYTVGMGFKLSLILGGLLVASLAGSTFLFNQLTQAKANQVILQDKISEQNESIKNYLADQEKHNAQLDNLEVEKQNALREVTKLRKTFAKHDLGNLALNKPKLIEKVINKGTQKVMDELTQITSPPQR